MVKRIPLTENGREMLFEQYVKAQESINDILSGKEINCFVKSPSQYLSPSVICEEQPLYDKRGEFMHYTIIRDTLERLLAGQPAEISEQFIKAPDFIKERLQEPATADSQ